jgi:hypothetical protein
MKRSSTKAIVIHTTASNSGNKPQDIQNYFLNVLFWRKGGYHIMYPQTGKSKMWYDWKDEATNGILPNPSRTLDNSNTIHLSYIGGINNANQNEAVCNITGSQETQIIEDIKSILKWYPNVKILGHNQINQKACPSFWVPDWLRAWGMPEANISDEDPYSIKEWVKTQVPHPANFYASRLKTENICPTCLRAL